MQQALEISDILAQLSESQKHCDLLEPILFQDAIASIMKAECRDEGMNQRNEQEIEIKSWTKSWTNPQN